MTIDCNNLGETTVHETSVDSFKQTISQCLTPPQSVLSLSLCKIKSQLRILQLIGYRQRDVATLSFVKNLLGTVEECLHCFSTKGIFAPHIFHKTLTQKHASVTEHFLFHRIQVPRKIEKVRIIIIKSSFHFQYTAFRVIFYIPSTQNPLHPPFSNNKIAQKQILLS